MAFYNDDKKYWKIYYKRDRKMTDDEIVEIDFRAVFDKILCEHAQVHGVEQTVIDVSEYVRERLTTLLAARYDALKHSQYT